MKRRITKKSEVLKEGYVKGLKKAHRIINEMLEEHDKCFTTKELKQIISKEIAAQRPRSAWDKGVNKYALDLAFWMHDEYPDASVCSVADLKKIMLNGARDWKQYSEGGCSLAYDKEIAERLCSPSELVKYKYGTRDPNSRETWIDVQTRALEQAWQKIREIFLSL